jgi:membrane-bound lytic murein transglycosylase D
MPREAAAVEGAGPAAELEGTDADTRQKEALDLCQSASELLAKGERQRAIQAIDQAYQRMLELPGDGDDTHLQAKHDLRQLIAKLLRDAYTRHLGTATRSLDLGLPLVDNEHVRREITSFTTVERDFFLESYRRSGLYRPMILAKLEAAGLPSQLSWLPVVESWFKTRAWSRAGAVGMWQFIASTGLRYGMTRDLWVDERMNPEKATDAAIAYLSDLHGLYGDWPKALAAYNCGEARVLRLQEGAQGFSDFWDLYEQLPRETRRYFPRFVATLLIVQDPGRYGMTLPEPLSPPASVAVVKTQRSVALGELEKALALPQDALRDLNPELRQGATPAAAYDLRVPAEHAASVGVKLAELPEWKPPRPTYLTHRVRSGQTIGAIARKYGTSVDAIRRANGLRTVRLRAGQRLRIPTTSS